MSAGMLEGVPNSVTDCLLRPDILSVVAAFASAIAAIASAVIAFFVWRTWWLEKRQRMLSEYRSDYKSRRNFWDTLRLTFKNYRNQCGDATESTVDFDEFLKGSLWPPRVREIPLDFQSWLRRHEEAISQEPIFQFTEWLYQQKKSEQTSDKGREAAKIFDLRSILIGFWDRWAEVFSKRTLIKRFGTKKGEMKILCWLEVSLAKGLVSWGVSKRKFYDLANTLCRKE